MEVTTFDFDDVHTLNHFLLTMLVKGTFVASNSYQRTDFNFEKLTSEQIINIIFHVFAHLLIKCRDNTLLRQYLVKLEDLNIDCSEAIRDFGIDLLSEVIKNYER